jgi:hypothetical protein
VFQENPQSIHVTSGGYSNANAMPKSLFFVAMQTPRMIATPEVLRAMLVLLEVFRALHHTGRLDDYDEPQRPHRSR